MLLEDIDMKEYNELLQAVPQILRTFSIKVTDQVFSNDRYEE
ncbi:hypothetical protein [Saccharolobus solfataricus]|uniref:Uncharacterized protein n=1 Tax=Saccharolobus solfataricus (strain 98/2) TaxID=555311 RepID=D0KNJ6_SACS9|nr:hypothetical protein [Saccharolobus solfataricus]